MALESGNPQDEQCWSVTQAVRTNHDSELDFRGALQEMLGVAGHRHPRGNEKERHCRNHDREEPIPTDSDQVVLQRRNDEEAPDQRSMIAGGASVLA